MPEIFAAIRSGQDLKSLSALYEYLGAVVVLTMPSAVALADWPAFEWGHTGVGPSFPSLDSLEILGVDMDQLQVVVNALYNLHAESPPMYLQGGALRKTLLRSLATQLMYYEERWNAVEMRVIQVKGSACACSLSLSLSLSHTHIPCFCSCSAFPLLVCLTDNSFVILFVQVKMQDVVYKHYAKVLHSQDQEFNAHSKLLEWGKAIKSDFDTKNVAFKLRHGQPDQVQVAAGFKLLNDLMRDSLAAQGGRLTQQGQQLARQETQIQNLQVTVSNQEKTISEMHAMMTQVHAALIPSGQGGAPAISFRAPLPAAPAPAPGSSTPGSDAASTAAPLLHPAAAIPSDSGRASALASAPPPAPGAVPSSDPKSSAHAGINSTQALSRTGVKEKAPGFKTHDSLIAVYVTFLRQKWRKAEDAGTWEDKHHRAAGATIFKWVHAIATEEENAILTRNRTDASGLSCPDVAKVQKNLEKLLIGVLYAVHKAHLPKVKMAAGLNYAGDFVQFWRNRKSIAKTTLQNTLDSIKSKLQTEPVKQRVFQDTDFSVPPKELIQKVRAEFATKRWLKDYISSHTGEGSPSKRRRQEEVAGAS